MRFTTQDQLAFAELSGDHNPWHFDADVARETVAGAPVVHGMNVVLRVLDEFAAEGTPLLGLRGLKTRFEKFIFLDRDVSWRLVARDGGSARIAIASQGARAVSVLLRFAPSRLAAGERLDYAGFPTVDAGAIPNVPTVAEMASLSGWLPAHGGIADSVTLFPRVAEAIGEDRLATLVLLSRLVGMICPGLHSIFTGLDAEFLAGEPDPFDFGFGFGFGFKVTMAHAVHRLVVMNVANRRLAGNLASYLREPAVNPARATMPQSEFPRHEVPLVAYS